MILLLGSGAEADLQTKIPPTEEQPVMEVVVGLEEALTVESSTQMRNARRPRL